MNAACDWSGALPRGTSAHWDGAHVSGDAGRRGVNRGIRRR